MIRPVLITWQEATKKLIDLTKNSSEDLRDETIEEIEKLLDERENIQPEIRAPFTEEEEAFGKQLVELEADLQKKLALYMKTIRTDISDAQSKKTHMKNYVNPYSNVARDGTYYDTKQ